MSRRLAPWYDTPFVVGSEGIPLWLLHEAVNHHRKGRKCSAAQAHRLRPTCDVTGARSWADVTQLRPIASLAGVSRVTWEHGASPPYAMAPPVKHPAYSVFLWSRLARICWVRGRAGHISARRRMRRAARMAGSSA